MGVILLVRHGQASWGAADYDNLSPVGEEQGGVVGQALVGRGVTPTRVIGGTLRRHGQTARAAVERAGWGTTVETDADWNEFDHVQMLEVHGPPDTAEAELTRQDFDTWFDRAMERWVSGQHDADYDEPFHAFTARVDRALRRTAAGLGSGETAVVFTSGGPISWVAATLLGGGIDMWMRLNPVTVNASVSKVVVGARGTTLVSVNDHSHLEPDLVTYR